MRFPVAVAFLVGIAWLAIQRGHPRVIEHFGRRAPIGRSVEGIQSVLRKEANLLGLWAYLAAMNRGLPNRQIVLDVFRSSTECGYAAPLWAGPVQPLERVPSARPTTSKAPISY